jgi:hypothetical protein
MLMLYELSILATGLLERRRGRTIDDAAPYP